MSDIPENLELIDHSGVSYKVGDVNALRAALELVVNDPKIVAERGERARTIVQRRYSWKSVVDRTEGLCTKLLKDV
jgi:glycosyltransferase involved in cell wall biosynthesis